MLDPYLFIVRVGADKFPIVFPVSDRRAEMAVKHGLPAPTEYLTESDRIGLVKRAVMALPLVGNTDEEVFEGRFLETTMDIKDGGEYCLVDERGNILPRKV